MGFVTERYHTESSGIDALVAESLIQSQLHSRRRRHPSDASIQTASPARIPSAAALALVGSAISSGDSSRIQNLLGLTSFVPASVSVSPSAAIDSQHGLSHTVHTAILALREAYTLKKEESATENTNSGSENGANEMSTANAGASAFGGLFQGTGTTGLVAGDQGLYGFSPEDLGGDMSEHIAAGRGETSLPTLEKLSEYLYNLETALEGLQASFQTFTARQQQQQQAAQLSGKVTPSEILEAIDLLAAAAVGKLACAFRAVVSRQLLEASLSLPEDIRYWREVEPSRSYLLLHIARSLPPRAWELVNERVWGEVQRLRRVSGLEAVQRRQGHPHFALFPAVSSDSVFASLSDSDEITRGDSYVSAPTVTSRATAAAMKVWTRGVGSAGFVGLVRHTVIRPVGDLLESARRDVRYRIAVLAYTRRMQAGSLGLLTQSGYEFGAKNVECAWGVRQGWVASTTKNKGKSVGKVGGNGNGSGSSIDGVQGLFDLRTRTEKMVAVVGGVLRELTETVQTFNEFGPVMVDVGRVLRRIEAQAASAAPTPALPSSLHLTTQLRTLLPLLQQLNGTFSTLRTRFGRPRQLTRYWPHLFASWSTYRYILREIRVYGNDMKRWADEAMATGRDFVKNWVVLPMRSVWETIRHRDTGMALMSAESLKSDLESLNRMVIQFVKDHGPITDEEIAHIQDLVSRGDLTPVLVSYESDIRHPLKSVISGDLLRSVLIQIQKAKVDGEYAMSALDKLLKSNELNFAVLAVIPSLLVLWFVGAGVRSWVGKAGAASREDAFEVVRFGLRELERILNRANQSPATTPRLASSGSPNPPSRSSTTSSSDYSSTSTPTTTLDYIDQ
ncbi:Nuclear control of ATPase protein 2, partial [Quaeritorhiza haematococci]